MFKRVERKRKRQEEEEELGLDEDMKEVMGLNDTDSDESDDPEGSDIPEDNDQGDTTSEDEHIDKEPISVAEALKDPIYLISLDPTVYGCILCRGKLIKNAGMAATHKNANAHIRRFEHFKGLSADANPHSNAWQLVRSISYVFNTQSAESQKSLSKRALKRQVKQATMREKRKHHKHLKTKRIAKKAMKRPLADETKNNTSLSIDSKGSSVSKEQSAKPRKKQKLDSRTLTARIMETADAIPKSSSRTKIPNDTKKLASKSRH